ncbi:YkyA family protein [Paenibacillus taichungensis]|uniref:YkyA family protein n=1 Tax=Paenibacillus taichungensis TaxID=484184 RepID=UPI0038CFD220
MSIRRKAFLVAVGIILMLMLSACGDPQEPAANLVNQLVIGDQQINENLDEIAHYESEDLDLYEWILVKGKEKNSDLESDLDKADVYINKRRNLLNQAQTIMEQNQEQISPIRSSLKKLSFEKEETLTQAQTILELYESRVTAFLELASVYNQCLDDDQQLYDMMRKNVEPNLEKIQQKIRVRNKEFGKLDKLFEQFNQLTDTFNNDNSILIEMEQKK